MVGKDKYSASGSLFNPTGFCPSPGANMYSFSCPISVSSGISSKSVSVFSTAILSNGNGDL
jgi:hypothetical protein